MTRSVTDYAPNKTFMSNSPCSRTPLSSFTRSCSSSCFSLSILHRSVFICSVFLLRCLCVVLFLALVLFLLPRPPPPIPFPSFCFNVIHCKEYFKAAMPRLPRRRQEKEEVDEEEGEEEQEEKEEEADEEEGDDEGGQKEEDVGGRGALDMTWGRDR